MGAWISFKYNSDLGKPVGHFTFIKNSNELRQILDRYHQDPRSLWDIKVNGISVKVETLIKKLSS